MTGQLLLRDVDSGKYYIADPRKPDKIPLDVPQNIRGLALSPNGKWIAYIPNENPALYILDVNGKTASVFPESTNVQPGIGLTWSPDSQKIAFSCRVQGTSGQSLCLANVANSQRVQVLVSSESLHASDVFDGAISPSWSSDGRKIAFLASSSLPSSSDKTIPTRDIWLFDFATNTAKSVLPNGSEGMSHIFGPVYLAGADSILFSGRTGKFNSIYNYELDSRRVQNITKTDGKFDLVDFVLSPDEKAFVVNIPSTDNPQQAFIPTLYSLDGQLLQPFNSLAAFQLVSWIVPR